MYVVDAVEVEFLGGMWGQRVALGTFESAVNCVYGLGSVILEFAKVIININIKG